MYPNKLCTWILWNGTVYNQNFDWNATKCHIFTRKNYVKTIIMHSDWNNNEISNKFAILLNFKEWKKLLKKIGLACWNEQCTVHTVYGNIYLIASIWCEVLIQNCSETSMMFKLNRVPSSFLQFVYVCVCAVRTVHAIQIKER